MIQTASRKRRFIALGFFILALLSLGVSALLIANFAAIPNARLSTIASMGSTIVLMSMGSLVALSNSLQNVKR